MTRGELKAAIQGLGYGDDTDAEQNLAVSAAVRRVAGMKRWPWQEATAGTATIVTGASTVSGLPADFLHPDAVRIEVGTEYPTLDWVSPQDIRTELHKYRDNGQPYWWTYYAGTIYVYPRADQVYTVTLDYVTKPADITSDTDELPGPETYHDLYKWLATQHMAFNERDWNAYNASKSEASAALAELSAEIGVKQRQTSRQVTRTGAYRSGAYLGPGSA